MMMQVLTRNSKMMILSLFFSTVFGYSKLFAFKTMYDQCPDYGVSFVNETQKCSLNVSNIKILIPQSEDLIKNPLHFFFCHFFPNYNYPDLFSKAFVVSSMGAYVGGVLLPHKLGIYGAGNARLLQSLNLVTIALGALTFGGVVVSNTYFSLEKLISPCFSSEQEL